MTKLPISALRFSEHDRYGVPDIHAFRDLGRGHVPLGLDELYSLWFGRFGNGRCQRFELWWGFGVGVGQVGDWHVAGLELAVVEDGHYFLCVGGLLLLVIVGGWFWFGVGVGKH